MFSSQRFVFIGSFARLFIFTTGPVTETPVSGGGVVGLLFLGYTAGSWADWV